MDRETLLEKGLTAEQVTAVLDLFHDDDGKNKKTAQENVDLKKQIADFQTKLANYEEIKEKLDAIEKEKMTDQEKIEAMKKETEKNLAESRIIKNQSKVSSILAEVGITDEDTIKSLVSDDEETSINNANAIAKAFKTMKEETEKKTKEEIQNANVKPNGSNVDPTQKSEVMDRDKFEKLLKENYTKAKEWKDNNLELYNEIMK